MTVLFAIAIASFKKMESVLAILIILINKIHCFFVWSTRLDDSWILKGQKSLFCQSDLCWFYFDRQELLILGFYTTRKVGRQELLILGFWTTRHVDSTQIQNQHSVPTLAFGDCRFPLCCFVVDQKQQNGSQNQQNGHTLQQSGTQKQQSGSQKQQSGCLRNNKMGLSSCIS